MAASQTPRYILNLQNGFLNLFTAGNGKEGAGEVKLIADVTLRNPIALKLFIY